MKLPCLARGLTVRFGFDFSTHNCRMAAGLGESTLHTAVFLKVRVPDPGIANVIMLQCCGATINYKRKKKNQKTEAVD